MAKEATPLLSAYLVVGNDELKTKTVIKRLFARLEKEGDVDFDSQILEAPKVVDVKELIDSLNTPPLASPFRLVVLEDVDKANKELTEALISYLQSPMPSTVLALTALKLTQQSRLYKAVKAISPQAIIEAADKKKSELPAMVRQLAQDYKISLSYDGAVKLAELVGTSTVALNTEVKKLASYVLAMGRSEATLKDVTTIVARTNEPSVWDFVDVFSDRDLALCFNTLRFMPRESPSNLLYLCVVRLRELLQYKSLVARGEGKLSKALGKPDWQIRRLEKISFNYDAAELRGLLSKAADCDRRMKSGEPPRQVLVEFLMLNCK